MAGRAEVKLALSRKARARHSLLGSEGRVGGLATQRLLCCRWRRGSALQRDRAQEAKLPEPPDPCSTRQLHRLSLAGLAAAEPP